RIAAARMGDANNMRQIGIALHAFHSDNGYLPNVLNQVKTGRSTSFSSATGTRSIAGDNLTTYGQILPYVEAQYVLDGSLVQTVSTISSSPTATVFTMTGPYSLQLCSPRVLVFENPADADVADADNSLVGSQKGVRPNGTRTATGACSYNFVM